MHQIVQKKNNIPQHILKKELGKAQLGNNIANHMAFIYILILYDQFGFSFKKVSNFYEKTVSRRKELEDPDNDSVTLDKLYSYCTKKKIDVKGFVKSIPTSQKMYMADIKKGNAVVGAQKNIDGAFLSTLLLTIPTLKETYKFSNEKISEFMKWIEYYIDMYYTKQPGKKAHYLDDNSIRQMFIEDEGWDIVTGEPVKGEKARE